MTETMNLQILVRPLTQEDETDWREMWNAYCEFYKTSLTDEVTSSTFERILDRESILFGLVATDATGKTLGFAHYLLHPHTWSDRTLCYLEDLFVKPETRGRGVGKRLIQALIERGKQEKWKRVYWVTQTDNKTARRLYNGFTTADDYVRYTVSIE